MPRILSRLTDEQIRTIRREIANGATVQQAAYAAGVGVSLIRERRKDQLRGLKVSPQGAGGKRGRARPPIPTEEEIYGRLTAEIRSRWDDERRDEAWIGGR